MKETLYELTGEYMALYGKLSDGEELTEEEMAMLLSLDGEIETKLEKYGRVITEAESDSARLDAEIKRLTKRKKSIDNNVSRMYTWLENAFIIHGMADKPIKTDNFTFRFRKSTSIEVFDQFIEWCREYNRPDLLNVTAVPNKTAIKEALEKGEEIPAWVQEKRKLRMG